MIGASRDFSKSDKASTRVVIVGKVVRVEVTQDKNRN